MFHKVPFQKPACTRGSGPVPYPQLFGAAGIRLLLSGTTATFPDTQLAQDDLERAEVRERGLEQIESDKGGEPKPVRTMIMR